MIVRYAAVSDVGCVRSGNEDMALADRQFLRDEQATGSVTLTAESRMALIVADGMGGNDGGELASDIAAQEFDTWLEELPAGLTAAEVQVRAMDMAVATHVLINARGRELDGFLGMGTTLCGAFVYEGHWLWINVGDSRLYLIRDGQMRQVSRDHSYRNLHNDPTLPSNLIYNALGGGEEFEAFADCYPLDARPADRLLVCSDGLCDMIDDAEIERLAAITDLQASAMALVEAAKAAGGADNITVLLADLKA